MELYFVINGNVGDCHNVGQEIKCIQVLMGLLVGYMLDKVSSHSRMFLINLQWILPNSGINLFAASLVLLTSGVGLYFCLQFVGLDPEFSVPRAIEYCQERSWVHPDTTPFYSLMRSTGELLGMAMIASSARDSLAKAEKQLIRRRGTMKLITKLVALIFSLPVIAFFHSECVPSFSSSNFVFYAVALSKAALVPCITLFPHLFICSL